MNYNLVQELALLLPLKLHLLYEKFFGQGQFQSCVSDENDNCLALPYC
jgi:hypothetical protein